MGRSVRKGLLGLCALAACQAAVAFQMPLKALKPTRAGRGRVRMDASQYGAGPYRGPSSFPLLDSVRYPHDMKQFNMKVRIRWLSLVNSGVRRPVRDSVGRRGLCSPAYARGNVCLTEPFLNILFFRS
jgi:hypothetical protein